MTSPARAIGFWALTALGAAALGARPTCAQSILGGETARSSSNNSHTGVAPPPYRKTVVELNGGVARPNGSMRRWRGFDGQPLFSDTAWGGITLGFRVSRLAQIDLGVDFTGPVVGPGRDGCDERLMRCSVGVPRDPAQPLEDPVSDGPMLLAPIGVRFIIPLMREHLLVGVGGGGALLFHGEANDRELQLPDGSRLRGCAQSCENRYGLGGYGLVRLEFVPGAGRRVGVGVLSRYTRGRLSGGAYLPRYAASSAADEWLQVGTTLTVRF